MATKYEFTEDDLVELIGDDLSLPTSLAKLINEGGNIREFLIQKLEEREEELEKFRLSQAPKWMDAQGFKESLGILRALGRRTY